MKVRFICICFLLLVLFSGNSASAEEEPKSGYDGEVLKDLEEFIPDSVRDYLPDALLSELEKGQDADPTVIANGTNRSYLSDLFRKACNSMLGPMVQALSGCIGLTVVSAIVSSFHPLGSESGDAMQYLVSVCVCVSLWKIGQGGLALMTEALTTVSVFIRSLLPTVAVLYAAGGNFTAGTIEEGVLLILLEVIESLCTVGLAPMLQVAFAFAVIAHVAGENKLQGLSTTVCRTITVILTFLVTVLTTVLSYQHSIAEGADGMLLRSVKFAASGVIPVIGGTLGEAMGSAMGAVSFLRATVGSVATVVVLIILLIPGMHLLGTRLALSISGMLSRALGCQLQAGLYFEIASVYDLAMAILAVCFFAVLFALALMVKCAVAAG